MSRRITPQASPLDGLRHNVPDLKRDSVRGPDPRIPLEHQEESRADRSTNQALGDASLVRGVAGVAHAHWIEALGRKGARLDAIAQGSGRGPLQIIR